LLLEYVDKHTISEIGKSISEDFGVSIAIVNPDGILDKLLKAAQIDTAMIALTDENSELLKVAYVSGDPSLVPTTDCLKRCGPGWWSLHEKRPVTVRDPKNDPRCKTEHLKKEVKTVFCWPLYFKERTFGVLYLISRADMSIEPAVKDSIDFFVLNVSFIFDIYCREDRALFTSDRETVFDDFLGCGCQLHIRHSQPGREAGNNPGPGKGYQLKHGRSGITVKSPERYPCTKRVSHILL